MKKTNTFGIHFAIRQDREKDGFLPVITCITVNKERVYIALQQKVAAKNWDLRKGQGKTTTPEGRELNSFLEEVRLSIGECYRTLQIQRKIITAETVKTTYLRNGSEEYTLSDIAKYHNDMSLQTLAQGTMKNYYTTQKYITEFVQKQYKRKEYFLTELNYKFIQDFEVFLRKHQPIDHQKPLTNNGIMKHLERLRKMINLAYRLEWIHRDPFEKYQLKFNRVEKEFLTTAELHELETKELYLPRLSMVRDIFVFCCYTGLAFVDVTNLKPTNICKGEDGGNWIKTSRQKNHCRG